MKSSFEMYRFVKDRVEGGKYQARQGRFPVIGTRFREFTRLPGKRPCSRSSGWTIRDPVGIRGPGSTSFHRILNHVSVTAHKVRPERGGRRVWERNLTFRSWTGTNRSLPWIWVFPRGTPQDPHVTAPRACSLHGTIMRGPLGAQAPSETVYLSSLHFSNDCIDGMPANTQTPVTVTYNVASSRYAWFASLDEEDRLSIPPLHWHPP